MVVFGCIPGRVSGLRIGLGRGFRSRTGGKSTGFESFLGCLSEAGRVHVAPSQAEASHVNVVLFLGEFHEVVLAAAAVQGQVEH